jgi:hypothetical protein
MKDEYTNRVASLIFPGHAKDPSSPLLRPTGTLDGPADINRLSASERNYRVRHDRCLRVNDSKWIAE